MPELEPEEALESAWEITDLDPHQKSILKIHRWVDGQRLSFRTRLWMAFCTIFGLALLAWLAVSPFHLPRASQLITASAGPIYPSSHQAPSRRVQMLVVQNVIYLLDQDGLLSALWTRHKYMYVLWQHTVAPSSKLVRVDPQVVYLATPDGMIIALRASDGAVLWSKEEHDGFPSKTYFHPTCRALLPGIGEEAMSWTVIPQV